MYARLCQYQSKVLVRRKIARNPSQRAKRGFCHENSFSDTKRTFCDVQHVRDPSQKLNIVSVMKIVFFLADILRCKTRAFMLSWIPHENYF